MKFVMEQDLTSGELTNISATLNSLVTGETTQMGEQNDSYVLKWLKNELRYRNIPENVISHFTSYRVVNTFGKGRAELFTHYFTTLTTFGSSILSFESAHPRVYIGSKGIVCDSVVTMYSGERLELRTGKHLVRSVMGGGFYKGTNIPVDAKLVSYVTNTPDMFWYERIGEYSARTT